MEVLIHEIDKDKGVKSYSVETDCGMLMYLSTMQGYMEMGDRDDGEVLTLNLDRIPAIVEAFNKIYQVYKEKELSNDQA